MNSANGMGARKPQVKERREVCATLGEHSHLKRVYDQAVRWKPGEYKRLAQPCTKREADGIAERKNSVQKGR